MIITDTTEAACEQYVSEVQQLVRDQLEVLFTMVTAGAARPAVAPGLATAKAVSAAANGGMTVRMTAGNGPKPWHRCRS